ncbi:MAG TPA: hypothetical protein VJ989_08995 [Solirubrobacterales bacterium]|nr:hypothetical protein [Solirubrobacterales bacterium]
MTISSIRFFADLRDLPELSLTIERCNLCGLGIVRAIATRSTRILAVGTLVAALACCWLAAAGAAQPRGPQPSQVTLGYNRAHDFFYGTARMPRKGDGSGGFACLTGNRHFPDGPRLLRIYRVRPGADRAISPDIAAGAKPESGALVWKFERRRVPTGRYYVVFEAKIPTAPYAPSECPGFRSRATVLPKPQRPR